MAEQILDDMRPGFFDNFEKGLANIGFDTPLKRFFGGTALGALAVYALKPPVAFNSDGSPRQWKYLASQGESGTVAPWYILATIPGIVFSTVI